MLRRPRVIVVGHVEWTDYVGVAALPEPGEILPATGCFQAPGAAAAVIAAQLAKLGARVAFVTALGADAAQTRIAGFFEELGIEVVAARLAGPQSRSIALLDERVNERSIVSIGEHRPPLLRDDLGWERLEGADAIVFTGGDPPLLDVARRATDLLLVHAARGAAVLADSAVRADYLIGSALDSHEAVLLGRAGAGTAVVLETAAADGGRILDGDGVRTWSATPPPGPPVDACGCGASFIGGVTFALAAGEELDEAVALGARCGAACVTGAGPFAGQLARVRNVADAVA